MTPIWIYDRDEILRLVLMSGDHTSPQKAARQLTQSAGMYIGYDEDKPREQPRRAIPYYNGWYTEQLNGKVLLEFDAPGDEEEIAWIMGDGRAVIKDQDGNLVEFIIRQPEDHDDMDGPVKSVYAEGADYELIDEWITGYKANGVDLRTALEAVLQGTRWEVGEIGEFGVQSVDFKDITVKNAVYQLTELFGGERRYRVEAEGNTITRRYIDILNRRGSITGKRFEDGKDIVTSRRQVDTTGIKTALYGRGESQVNDGPRITFASVEWIGPEDGGSDPITKPLGQTWIGDPEALQQWGYDQGKRHRWGFYDGQESDPGQLLLNSWNYLQEVNDAVFTYDFGVVLLQDLTGYSHEKVRLGDTTSAINRRISPAIEVEASIIEYKQNLNDETKSKVKLGSFRSYYDVTKRVHGLERTVHTNSGNWRHKETPAGAQEKVDTAFGQAQENIDAAQKRIDQAELDIDAAEEEIAQTQQNLQTTAENLSAVDSQLQSQLETNEQTISAIQTDLNAAEQDIDIAQSDISTAQQDIQSARTDLNAITTENADGTLALYGKVVTTELVSENATITGTFVGSSAIFQDITVKNATITGTLQGVDGTFVGELQAATGDFAGSLTAATGTFAGDLEAAGGSFAGTLQAVDGEFTGTLRAVDGEFVGSLSAASGTFAGSLQAATGTFTGTLQAVNGTFTGSLDGVDGTFTGDLTGGRILSNTSITVSTDLYVGDSIFIGDFGDRSTQKTVYFNDLAHISGGKYAYGDSLSLVANSISLDGKSVSLGDIASVNGGGTVPNDYPKFLLGWLGNTPNQTGMVIATDDEPDDRPFEVRTSSNGGYVGDPLSESDAKFTVFGDGRVESKGEIYTPNSEKGYCGVGVPATGSTGPVGLQGVNFRMKKTYTPSSISFQNLNFNTGPNATQITKEGFSFYINGGGNSLFTFWRGYYVA